MGRPGEALEYIAHSLRLSPGDVFVPFWIAIRGDAELELGHNEIAIEHFQHALSLKHDCTQCLAGLIAASALSGNMSKAHIYLAELQKMVPQVKREDLLARMEGATGIPRRSEGFRLATVE
jgi:tetratricopeptide (TPR) repeat protein